MKKLLIIIFLFALVDGLYSFNTNSFTAKVVKIIDGDTIIVMTNNKEIRVKLYGIDCPELNQPYGIEAKSYISNMYRSKVEILGIDIDKHNRLTALTYHKYSFGRNTMILPWRIPGFKNPPFFGNEGLIKEGLAWAYPENCTNAICKDLKKFQVEAKKKKKGLWKDKNPTPPWLWKEKQELLFTKSKEPNKRIKEYFEEALRYYKQYEFIHAAKIWQKVLQLDHNHQKAKTMYTNAQKKYTAMMTYYYYGLAAMQTNNWQGGIDKLSACLMINPRHKDARHYIEICYKKLGVNIKIVDQPKKEANEIGNRILLTDEELVLYAIGFDRSGKYIGPIAVLWRSTGTLDKVDVKEKVKNTSFVPETLGTEGTIEGYLPFNFIKEKKEFEIVGTTGKIVVRSPEVNK